MSERDKTQQNIDLTADENVAEIESAASVAEETDAVEENLETSDQEQSDSQDDDDVTSICKERDEYLHDLQRLQAEFDNFRKRTIRERSEMREFLLQEFIGRLLDVNDNLDRALNTDANDESHESFRDGVKMIQQQMMTILTDYGLERIKTDGEMFDPSFHEAMMQIESDEHEPGQIVSEFMPGYMLKERVLRAAKVQVAQAPEGAAADANNDETNNEKETE